MKVTNLLSHNWLAYYSFHRQLYTKASLIQGDVFDFGCGSRAYEAFALINGTTYLGIDWSQSAHGRHMDVIADLNQGLPMKDDSADTIISISVMEHLKEPQMMLREAFRLLRPGGKLVLQVPFQWHIHEAPHDYFRFTQHGLAYLATSAGFKDINIDPTTGFWTTWFLKLNYHQYRWIHGSRFRRVATRALLTPFWLFNQSIAMLLDRRKPNVSETQGYLMVATK